MHKKVNNSNSTTHKSKTIRGGEIDLWAHIQRGFKSIFKNIVDKVRPSDDL